MKTEKQNKVRVTLTISPDTKSFVDELGINISQFLDTSLKRLKYGIGDAAATPMNMIMMCSPTNNTGMIDAADPSRINTVTTSGYITPGVVSADARSLDLSAVSDGDNLPYNGGYSMACFLKSRESKWIRYMKNKGSQERTYKELLRDIYKLTWLYDVESIKDADDITKHDKDAVYSVCAFIKTELPESNDTFNGAPNLMYRSAVNTRYKCKRGSRYDQKSHDLINHPDVVMGTMQLLDDDCKIFFAITAVTGARTAQLERIYQQPLKIIKHEKEGFFRIIAVAAGQGQKHATEYFLPIYMLPMVEEFKPSSGKHYTDAVNKVSRVVDSAVPCNLSSLRKLTKQIFSESDMSESAAEYTQGRRAEGVGARAYDNLAVKAVREYPKVIPLWKKYMPLPSWMMDRDAIRKHLDANKKQKSPGGK